MKARVIKDFHDKETHEYYKKGHSYSHDDEGRINFLIEKGFLNEKSKGPSKKNDNYPKHVGGGYYELLNGEKVKGKKDAEKAMRGDD